MAAMPRIAPRTPDGCVRILHIPVHGGDSDPDMTESRDISGGVFISGNLPQLMVGIVKIDPVRQPEYLVHPEHSIAIAIAFGPARNAMRVDYRSVANFPFAPTGLGKAERHVVVFRKVTAGAIELD